MQTRLDEYDRSCQINHRHQPTKMLLLLRLILRLLRRHRRVVVAIVVVVGDVVPVLV